MRSGWFSGRATCWRDRCALGELGSFFKYGFREQFHVILCQNGSGWKFDEGSWADSTRSARWPPDEILPAFCPQIAPIWPFLPVMPIRKCCAVYNLGLEALHGMEEVVGSIPTRSTNLINNLETVPLHGLVAFW